MKTHGEYFLLPMEKGAFYGIKNDRTDKKFGSKTAVDNLNITLTNGVYGLLGANGAGKTTLMRLLCNIQNPTSGKILLNGKTLWGWVNAIAIFWATCPSTSDITRIFSV